jgi:hypothetical protein
MKGGTPLTWLVEQTTVRSTITGFAPLATSPTAVQL